MRKIIFLLVLTLCRLAHAQIVQSPIQETVRIGHANGEYYPGRSYYQWVVDINHDGTQEVLISLKETPDELKLDHTTNRNFDSDIHGFYVFVPTAGGYTTGKAVEGDASGGDGITVNTSRCYLGYVNEIKRYGLVTVEVQTLDDPDVPQAKHGVVKQQVICYTVETDHLKRWNLTPLLYPEEKHSIYDKYLSDIKRSNVTLQEVVP